MDGIAKVAFLFLFWRERICMIHICRASAIKTCRSHDLVSSVLFCSALSLSLSPSTYPHIWELCEWNGIPCAAIQSCVLHIALSLPFDLSLLALGFVLSILNLTKSWVCVFILIFHRKKMKERKLCLKSALHTSKENYFCCFFLFV